MFTKISVLCAVLVLVTNIAFPAWSEETGCTSKGFGLTIATDRAIYHPEEPITVTLTVFNYTRDTVSLVFRSTQRYDFLIEKEGEEIWRWSTDKVFAMVMGDEMIGPGESLVYGVTYGAKEKLTAGVYCVRGMLASREPFGTLEGTVCIQVRQGKTGLTTK